jgi:hypothetical protein
MSLPRSLCLAGADRAVAEVLAASLFFVPNVTAEDEAAATASLVAGYAAGAVNASALSQLGLVMGTTELGEDFYSLQLEPAFVNSEDVSVGRCVCGKLRRSAGHLVCLPCCHTPACRALGVLRAQHACAAARHATHSQHVLTADLAARTACSTMRPS